MPLLARAAWTVLLPLLVLSGCRKREEAPEAIGEKAQAGKVETEAVAADLPAGAAIVISTHDLEDWWTRLKSTQFYTQLRAVPEVQRLLDPAQNPQTARAFERFQTVFGVPLNEQTVFNVLGDKIQLGIYPGAAAADTAADTTAVLGRHRLVLVADMEDKDAMTSILNNFRTKTQGAGGSFETEEYKDVELTIASGAGGEVRGVYGFHKDKLVAATDVDGVRSAVDALDDAAATMGGDTLYQRALSHVGEADATVFVRSQGYREFVGAIAESGMGAQADTSGRARRMLEVADKYDLQVATVGGSNWTDEGLLIRSYMLFDRDRSAVAPLLEMFDQPPSDVRAVGYFPDSTLGFYALNFLDAPKIYDFVVSYMRDLAAVEAGAATGGAARVDQEIARFESLSGMSIRNDILGWMGREVALGLNGVVKGGFFPIPEVTLIVQSTDQARAKSFFDRLESKIVETLQQSPQAGFPIEFQEEDYKGVKIRYAPTPMGEGLAPAYALHGDYVLVALARGTLERMLDVKTGAAKAVESNPRFAALSGFYPGESNLVGWLDTARLFTEIGSTVSTLRQMGGPQSGQPPDAFVRTIGVLENIQAVGTYGVNDEGGVEQRILIRIQ